jgi:TRAP-type C4-dicarboxylate transport system permease small subunit
MEKKTMDKWNVFEKKLCAFLLIIAGLTLAFMLVFTVLNVLMRALGKPIVGDFEIISFLGAVVVGFALPYTSMRKGHVAVDFLLEKVSKKTGNLMQVFTRIISIALFLWIGWNFVIAGLDLIKSGEVTPVFRLPYYPISFGIALACLIQCLVLALDVQELIGGQHE